MINWHQFHIGVKVIILSIFFIHSYRQLISEYKEEKLSKNFSQNNNPGKISGSEITLGGSTINKENQSKKVLI